MNRIYNVNELRRMKVKELKQICKDRKIKYYSRLRKRDLIDLIYESNKEVKNIIKPIKCYKCDNMIDKDGPHIKNKNKLYHLSCYNQEEEKVEKNDCSICLEKINKDEEIITECNHKFHKKCLKQWEDVGLKRSCPNCRGCTKKIMSINKLIREIVYLVNHSIDNNINIKYSMETLLLNTISLYNAYLLKTSGDDPELIFEDSLELLLQYHTQVVNLYSNQ